MEIQVWALVLGFNCLLRDRDCSLDRFLKANTNSDTFSIEASGCQHFVSTINVFRLSPTCKHSEWKCF